MINKTEKEITKNWNDDINKPMVSICCITYNHENYLSTAIDSFLMQETTFPFEILIHDDKSNDNTKKIILNYQNKYPKLIRSILQDENQYSKGKKVMPILFNIAEGEYIALCEGDDYWTDKNKLQIQINEMKKNPTCNISFHPATALRDNKLSEVLSKHANQNKIFTTAEVILGGGGFSPTASLVLKRKVVKNLPNWFAKVPVGDYFLQTLGAYDNGILYINKNMSIYRIGHAGSWMSTLHKKKSSMKSIELEKHISNKEKFSKDMLHSLTELNEYFFDKYNDQINIVKSNLLFAMAMFYLENNLYENFLQSLNKSNLLYKNNSFVFRFVYIFKLFPKQLNLSIFIYKKIKKAIISP